MFIPPRLALCYENRQAWCYGDRLAACLNSRMDTPQQLVTALAALCEREGGHENVADKAGVSAPYLWQIVHGTLMPSGRPRGVGRRIAEKLDAAFPGWTNPQHTSTGVNVYPVARDVSHPPYSDELPLLSWEAIMKRTPIGVFRLVLQDESLAPEFPANTELAWSTRRRALPGRDVLVRAGGQLHARRYTQSREAGIWIAAPLNPSYVSFRSDEPGFELVAVSKGKLEPDDA